MAKKRKKKQAQVFLSPEKNIKQNARKLPIAECYINDDWRESDLANIIVVREHKSENITAGFYIADLACKGVKNSFYKFNISRLKLDEHIASNNFIECEYKLAHNIIYESLAYAEDYGFVPHKDFEVSKYILEEDDEKIAKIEIHVGGEDGQPLLIEFDPVRFAKDIQILNETAGEGNYHYIKGFENDDDFDDEIDDSDDELDDFDNELDKLDEDEKKLLTKFMTINLRFLEIYKIINGQEYVPSGLSLKNEIEKIEYRDLDINSNSENLLEELSDCFDGDPQMASGIIEQLIKVQDTKDIYQSILALISYSENYQNLDDLSNHFIKKYPSSVIPYYFLALYYIKEEYDSDKALEIYEKLEFKIKDLTDYHEFIYFYSLTILILLEKGNMLLSEEYLDIIIDVMEKYKIDNELTDQLTNYIMEYKEIYIDEKADDLSDEEIRLIEKNVTEEVSKFTT